MKNLYTKKITSLIVNLQEKNKSQEKNEKENKNILEGVEAPLNPKLV